MGRPPKTIEQKRRLGNPGKRPLPEPNSLPVLLSESYRPEPLRNLAAAGRTFWDRVWSHGFHWISDSSDIELVQMLCEHIDERQQLRFKVLKDGDWRERAALRSLDKQIVEELSLLGFSPTDRSRLGLAEVRVANELEEYRNRKTNVVDATLVSE